MIKELRSLGLPIEAIRAVVSIAGCNDADCTQMHATFQSHLSAVRAKVTQLQEIEQRLAVIIAECSTCAGGPVSNCTIVRDISPQDPTRTACCCQ